MKFKFLLSLLCAGTLVASAQSQGYKDGIEYYKADQFENARTILERTLNDATTDKSMAYYYLGEIALRKGNLADAKDRFDKGIAANDGNGFNYVGLGALALKQGNPKAAKEQFDLAKKCSKKNASLLVAIARAYYNADPVAYAKEYEKYMADAFKADKNNTDIYIMRGDKLLAEDNVGEAAGNYENAIYNNPSSAEAYVKYANAYIHVNPQFAIAKLKELNTAAPNSALAQRELAEKYYENDQWTRAAQQYGEYIKNPNHFPEDEERYVVLLYFGQNYDQSYDLARRIIAKNPNSFLMKRMLFLNRAAQNNYTEAEALARDFFATVPPSDTHFTSNDYTTYGDVLTELGNDSIAILQYEKAVEINPDKAELLKGLSSAYYNAKKYDKAADAYQRFVDTGEGKTNDLYVLAGRYMTLAASQEPASAEKAATIEKALSNINVVLERVPDDYRILQRKARIQLVANDNEPNADMAATYRQAIDMLNADAENLTKHADVYREAYTQLAAFELSQDNTEAAKAYYEKMLEMDPTNEQLRQYIEKMK